MDPYGPYGGRYRKIWRDIWLRWCWEHSSLQPRHQAPRRPAEWMKISREQVMIVMFVLWQVGLGTGPWWRHLVLLRFIDFNKCNSSRYLPPKSCTDLATGLLEFLFQSGSSWLLSIGHQTFKICQGHFQLPHSWLWWTQPTSYCQIRIHCKIYRAQIYRDCMSR